MIANLPRGNVSFVQEIRDRLRTSATIRAVCAEKPENMPVCNRFSGIFAAKTGARHTAISLVRNFLRERYTISGNLVSFKEPGCDIISIGSEESPDGRHQTEDLWSMQVMGASTDMFFIVAYSAYLCREFL